VFWWVGVNAIKEGLNSEEESDLVKVEGDCYWLPTHFFFSLIIILKIPKTLFFF